MKKLLASTALIALLTAGMSGMAHAQTDTVTDPGHPRINEVDQRLQDQNSRVDTGVTNGQIGAKQEMRDNNADAHVSQELSKDEAKDGGHITKAQQRKMNRQLNKNSRRIHRQRKAKPATTTTTPAAQ